MATVVSQSVLSRWQTLVRYFGPCVATLSQAWYIPVQFQVESIHWGCQPLPTWGLPFKCTFRVSIERQRNTTHFNGTRRTRTGRLPKEHPTTSFGFYYKGRQHRNIAMPLPFRTEPTFTSCRFATLPPAIRSGTKIKSYQGRIFTYIARGVLSSLPGCLHHSAAAGVLNTVILRSPLI